MWIKIILNNFKNTNKHCRKFGMSLTVVCSQHDDCDRSFDIEVLYSENMLRIARYSIFIGEDFDMENLYSFRESVHISTFTDYPNEAQVKVKVEAEAEAESEVESEADSDSDSEYESESEAEAYLSFDGNNVVMYLREKSVYFEIENNTLAFAASISVPDEGMLECLSFIIEQLEKITDKSCF